MDNALDWCNRESSSPAGKGCLRIQHPRLSGCAHLDASGKGKLLENDTLVQQAGSNSKEQFANSPDLKDALMHAIMDALEAHSSMSSQALGSERVRNGLKDILLGPAELYEALRAKAQGDAAAPWDRQGI